MQRGDKVAATAREHRDAGRPGAKYGDAILPIQLDVTDRDADFAAVKQAHDHFGRLDIVVNNAGYGQFGFVEELSEQEARDQIETNVFGALWITQAALPYLREQGSGHIIQVSSIGGITRVSLGRHLPRLEVGAGGLLAGAGSRGRAVRCARHADRAGRASTPTGPARRRERADPLPAYAEVHAATEAERAAMGRAG